VSDPEPVHDLSLQKAMTETAAATDRMLDELLPDDDDPESRLHDAMRYAALGGGKRLRPFLTVQAASLFGVNRESALRVGAAIEMVHAYSLVHDDLPAMDDDDLRRGKPTVHKQFDEATAILAGDALLTLAFEVLADSRTHSDAYARAELVSALALAAGARGMVGGQMLDLIGESRPLAEGEIIRMQMMKTGRMIIHACEAGALLGRAGAGQRHALVAYGHDLGLAFQIVDDLLDVTGDPEETGKATGKDAAAGKATLVAALGVEGARERAVMLADQAAQHLDSFDEKADCLKRLAAFVVSRRA
jgi:farnesyl diphosphate synthase